MTYNYKTDDRLNKYVSQEDLNKMAASATPQHNLVIRRIISEYEHDKKVYEEQCRTNQEFPDLPSNLKEEELCEVCKKMTKQVCICPSEILGTYHQGPFKVKYVLACFECRHQITYMENACKGSL